MAYLDLECESAVFFLLTASVVTTSVLWSRVQLVTAPSQVDALSIQFL